MKKIILITGAASGFGKEATRQLLEQGHTVYAADIKEIEDLGGDNLFAVQLDVTDSQAINSLAKRIIDEQGKIDVLANNAGYAVYDIVENADIDIVRRQFEVNFWAGAMLTRAVLPHMRQARAGRIVNTSSSAGRFAGPLMGWYSASKYAVEGFTDALRIEAGQFGINVSLIEPGTFKTGFGGVVQNHFANIECDQDYQQLIDYYIKGYADRQAVAPTPEPIVEALMDAILGEAPKTRYLIGDDGVALVNAKAQMSDEDFDNVFRQQLGIN